jgi:2-polyprenyl-3-methyl-5-hydroxy-6-metoxy-1,4-benzoquinol methylase
VANLEQDTDNLKLKIDDETAKVFSWLPQIDGLSILDLGAGVGQWSFRFAERGAQRVLAVEYAEGLAEIGRKEALQRKLTSVEFRVSPAELFQSDEQFDVVYISGLFVYLTEEQADRLMANVANFVRPGGTLLLRDGTGIERRHEINDRHSEHLGENYSATYRTRDEYLALMKGVGLELERDENMFPEGHPLNKYPETRLRLYLFRKPA